MMFEILIYIPVHRFHSVVFGIFRMWLVLLLMVLLIILFLVLFNTSYHVVGCRWISSRLITPQLNRFRTNNKVTAETKRVALTNRYKIHDRKRKTISYQNPIQDKERQHSEKQIKHKTSVLSNTGYHGVGCRWISPRVIRSQPNRFIVQNQSQATQPKPTEWHWQTDIKSWTGNGRPHHIKTRIKTKTSAQKRKSNTRPPR